MQQQFNVPIVIRISDSLGHVVTRSSLIGHPDWPAMLDYSRDDKSYLRSGDTISIEVDVDPSFDAASYEIKWSIANIGGPNISGHKFTLLLTDKYVSVRFTAVCRVTSNATWHKLGTHDDQIDIAYRVLPPL
jgi:NADPH-dependent 2,4-dienoyl-CoA reductase/sulfur reductase-like enzyme